MDILIKKLFLLIMLCFFSEQVFCQSVSLPFSTSFEDAGCTEGKNLYLTSGCGGLHTGGNKDNVVCPNEYDSLVLSIANNPSGSGRGVRHYVEDGKNYQGGTFALYFASLQTELWIRFYIRYPAGFQWNPLQEHKLLWVADGLPGSGRARVFSLSWGDSMRFWNHRNTDGNEVVQGISGHGWNILSDGNWHYAEAHLKYGTNGHEDAWLDGTQVINRDLDMTNSIGGWTTVEFQTNADAPDNDACVWVDMDDIAVSSTGYIGSLQGGTVPTVSLTANPSTISLGQSSTLSWSSTDATSCTASGSWSGTKSQSGTESVSPTATSTYTLTCTGSGGSANQSVTVMLMGTIFFTENFDDTNFAARGWYDVTTGTIDTANKYEGTGSLQCSFAVGGTGCQGNAPRRRKFTPSDSVYISYWTRMSSNWVGSGLSYHPHIIYLLTTLNGDWDGYYGTYLTTYLEQRDKTMVLGIQDALNIYGGSSPSQPPSPVSGENKGLAGCNGLFDGSAHGNTDQDCFWGGSLWLNGRWYRASAPSFSTSCPGSSCLTDWHHVEAYFKMNTITAGVSNADGIMKVSVDGTVLYNYTDIRFRTGYGANATKQFNQFGLSPYIGDGSPVAQTIWFDNLIVAQGEPASILQPTNLRIIP